MNAKKFDINSLRIASPCSVGWESMSGDERTRHCGSCDLNVYNISSMTEPEARSLIESREGRLCIRMFRRHDGTVITKDCPVGLRAFQKRVARVAGAAFATIIGFFSFSYGQKPVEEVVDRKKSTWSVSPVKNETGVLNGTVFDANGAVIPNVPINLYKNSEKILIATVHSDKEGFFEFRNVAEGNYRLETGKVHGFIKFILQNLEVRKEIVRSVSLEMTVAPKYAELIGVVGETPPVDLTSNEQKTVITREMLDRLPGGRPF